MRVFFTAHTGVALAAQAAAPRVRRPVLLLAANGLDLMCFGLTAAGVERIQLTLRQAAAAPEPPSYPWSHGLFMAGIWSGVTAAAAARAYQDRRTGAVLGLVVLSHWVLDWIAHAPDLPVLFNRSRRVGLGLHYSADGTIHWRRALAAEAGLLGAGYAVNRMAGRA